MPGTAEKTFSIVTFGCKVNAYESEAIKEQLSQAGFRYQAELPTDFIIVNTCAVTLTAEKKDMEKLRSLVRNYPDSKIVALGCFAQLHPDRILGLGKNIQAVLGTKDRTRIADFLNGKMPQADIDKNSRFFAYEESEISSFSGETRAFLKIQDGCDNFCSYCIIPLVRGKSRSRKKEDILKETQRLAEAGYQEIVLIGIDTGSYQDGETRLADLIQEMLQVQPQTFRLRISSLEMSQIDEKLIAILEKNPRLVPHLHIPLQSGSERILQEMGRKYDLEKFASVCAELQRRVKNLALSTDIIVGFPGESEEDFLQTCRFAERIGFMRLHVFPYSPRPFTRAAKMPQQLEGKVKEERVRRLMAVGQKLAAAYLDSYLGRPAEVIVEEEVTEAAGKKHLRGYSENYLDLSFAGPRELIGHLVLVEIQAPGQAKLVRVLR
jgi:threonylcarbamoyladenosine tRNA methylthiotransferase MtaB